MTDTYQRLISAALDLLDSGGSAAVTLREVGHRAGVSHNTPYRHFTNKRDLLAYLAAAELRELARQLNAIEQPGTQRLAMAAHGYVSWARAHPERFRLTFGVWTQPSEELADAAAEASTALREVARQAHAEGAGTGFSSDRIAYLMWSLAHGAVQLDLSGHLRKDDTSPSTEQVVDDFVTLLSDTR